MAATLARDGTTQSRGRAGRGEVGARSARVDQRALAVAQAPPRAVGRGHRGAGEGAQRELTRRAAQEHQAEERRGRAPSHLGRGTCAAPHSCVTHRVLTCRAEGRYRQVQVVERGVHHRLGLAHALDAFAVVM